MLLIIILFVSCGPARDSQGHYWKRRQVWNRVIARMPTIEEKISARKYADSLNKK